MRRYLPLSLTLLLLAGCGEQTSDLSATPEGRFALGVAADYPAAPLSPAEQEQIKESVLRRRQLAWSAVQRVVEEVTPAGHSRASAVPRWMTWYGKDDLDRIFSRAFTALPADDRRRRATLTPLHFQLAESWAADQLLYLPQWNDERRAAFLAGLSDDELLRGSSGLTKTLFSRSAARHIISHYNDVSACAGSACLTPQFPADSVVIKTQWARRGPGFPVSAFSTNAVALGSRLNESGLSWDHTDRYVPHIGQRSLSLKMQGGAQFDLTGLHIMSKESKDWLWITLWWSDTPDEDFGEDRPDSLRRGPWANYKMCVAGDFQEEAEDDEELLRRFPSLGAALLSARDASGLSWCSNPYLEKGEHNQKTNCMGCHQHAGSDRLPEDVIADGHQGRPRAREQFPADYIWSLDFGPENIGHMLSERVRYHTKGPVSFTPTSD